MGSVNLESIKNKAKKCMASDEKKKEIWRKTDSYMKHGIPVSINYENNHSQQGPAIEAASRFVRSIKQEITYDINNSTDARNGGVGEAGKGLLRTLISNDTIDYEDPYRVNNLYYIHIFFGDDLHRDSLYPEKYSGIDNIAALLNAGYTARKSVSGLWHGRRIRSLAHRRGLHFADRAINDFIGNYGARFGIVDVLPNTSYKIEVSTWNNN